VGGISAARGRKPTAREPTAFIYAGEMRDNTWAAKHLRMILSLEQFKSGNKDLHRKLLMLL
jgi:hypothetical protein